MPSSLFTYLPKKERLSKPASEAITKYFPTVSAMGLGYMADKGLVQMDLGGGIAMSLLKHGYNASVTAMQPIFAGGQIVITFEVIG